MRRLALAVLLLAPPALAPPVLAEDRPKLTPTRDVDVIYAIAGPKGPLPQRLRWGVSQGKLRVDPPSPGLFMVVDTASRRMETVRETDHVVVQIDSPGALPGQVGPGQMGPGKTGAGFQRRGTAHIAMLDCTQWATADTDGRPVLACITDDGVLLQAKSGDHVLVEAVEVRYSPQDSAVFRVPEGYRRVIADPVKR